MALRQRPTLLAAALLAALAACESTVTYEPTAAPAVTAEVGRPSFTPGDEFWYTTARSTFVEVFEGEEDGHLLFDRGVADQLLVYSPDLALEEVRTSAGLRRAYLPDDGRLEFPLRVGKTWERSYKVFNAGGGRHVQRTRACQVAERGFATVPAGRFAVLRIDCALSEVTAAEVVREQVFYAPEVGRIILRRSERQGYRERLLEYTRAAPP